MMQTRKKVAVVNSHPIQYFAPLYQYISRSPDIGIEALYLSDFSLRGGRDPGFGQDVTWDVDLLGGYDSRFIGPDYRTLTPAGFWSLKGYRLWTQIRNGGYDAVWVHGHQYLGYVIAIMAAAASGIPVFMRCETHLGLQRSAQQQWLRPSVLKSLYSRCSAFLAIGSANADFYRSLGISESRIFLVPYTVDNDRFISASHLAPDDRAAILRKYSFDPNVPVILYAAKFQNRKHPDDLIEAFRALKARGVRAQLAMVGSGEMEADLVRRAGGDPDIKFLGFVNQAEMPRIYGASDMFVLPSENEPWGLAINEAMCAGLPIVASAEIGCVRDLVHHGRNGLTFSANDIPALSQCLERLTVETDFRNSARRASMETIQSWSYAQCVEGLRQALAAVSVPHAKRAP